MFLYNYKNHLKLKDYFINDSKIKKKFKNIFLKRLKKIKLEKNYLWIILNAAIAIIGKPTKTTTATK